MRFLDNFLLRGLGMGLGWKGDDGTRMDVPDGSNMRKQMGTISLNLHQTDTSKDLRELSVYRRSLCGFLRGHQARDANFAELTQSRPRTRATRAAPRSSLP